MRKDSKKMEGVKGREGWEVVVKAGKGLFYRKYLVAGRKLTEEFQVICEFQLHDNACPRCPGIGFC